MVTTQTEATHETVTDADIEKMFWICLQSGDYGGWDFCDRAQRGDHAARERVARWVVAARAKGEMK